MLSEQDKQLLLTEFPENIKLSYENIIHKKVYNADINLAIPCGIKSFLWFTVFKNKNICLLMITHNHDIQIKHACFSSDLSYGTILYGTLFFYKSNQFFSIEDIFYLKGKNIENE